MYSKTPKLSFSNVSTKLLKVEHFWILDAQTELQDDFMKGRFCRLSARKRDDGIIVVGTRAEPWMEMSYNQNDVVLLPSSHRFSRLYAEFIHSLCHSGVATTTSKVRRKFWIIRLQRIAESVRHHCIHCQKMRKVTH